MPPLRHLIPALCLLAGAASFAQTPAPTLANVPYGKHEKQVLDFYSARTSRQPRVMRSFFSMG